MKYEVAEQYYRAPSIRLQLELIKAGVFGKVHVAEMAHVGHGYHGTSLLRAFLGFDYAPARVTGVRRTYPVQAHKWHGVRGQPSAPARPGTSPPSVPGGELGAFTFTNLSYNSPIRFRDAPLQEHDALLQVDSARTTRFFAEKGMAAGDEMVIGGHRCGRINVTHRTHVVDGQETLAALEADVSPRVVWENPCATVPSARARSRSPRRCGRCAAPSGRARRWSTARAAPGYQEMMLGLALSAGAGGARLVPLGEEHLEARIPHHSTANGEPSSVREETQRHAACAARAPRHDREPRRPRGPGLRRRPPALHQDRLQEQPLLLQYRRLQPRARRTATTRTRQTRRSTTSSRGGFLGLMQVDGEEQEVGPGDAVLDPPRLAPQPAQHRPGRAQGAGDRRGRGGRGAGLTACPAPAGGRPAPASEAPSPPTTR